MSNVKLLAEPPVPDANPFGVAFTSFDSGGGRGFADPISPLESALSNLFSWHVPSLNPAVNPNVAPVMNPIDTPMGYANVDASGRVVGDGGGGSLITPGDIAAMKAWLAGLTAGPAGAGTDWTWLLILFVAFVVVFAMLGGKKRKYRRAR